MYIGVIIGVIIIHGEWLLVRKRLPVLLLQQSGRCGWDGDAYIIQTTCSGRDVCQMEGRAHHGDYVADGHAQMHLSERAVNGHVMRAVDQRAQVVVAHLGSDSGRLLYGRFHGDQS